MIHNWNRTARRSISSVVPWLLVIGACVSLATGHLSMRGCAKSTTESEEDARKPARRDIRRYDARLIDAVRIGSTQKSDWLNSFQSFEEVWRVVSPDQPLWIQTISPRALDSASKEIIPPAYRRAVLIDKENFGEHRLLLRDIQGLILSGDGTGRGFVKATRFDVEPAEQRLPATQAGETAIGAS